MMATFIIGCETENSVPVIQNNLNQDFLTTLETFNHDYHSKLGTHTTNEKSMRKCSECWGGFTDFLIVAGADIVGAGAGAVAVKEIAAGVGIATGGSGAAVVVGAAAVVSGAGASIAANSQLNDKNYSKPEMYTKNLNIEYPDELEYLANIGSLHNVQVFNTLSGKNNYLFGSKTGNDFTTISKTPEWQGVMSEIENSINEYSIHNDINLLTSSIAKKELITSNTKTVLDIFFGIYNKAQNSHNIQDIVNYYITAINKESTLSNTEKEALISAFSVASESPYFWENQE